MVLATKRGDAHAHLHLTNGFGEIHLPSRSPHPLSLSASPGVTLGRTEMRGGRGGTLKGVTHEQSSSVQTVSQTVDPAGCTAALGAADALFLRRVPWAVGGRP